MTSTAERQPEGKEEDGEAESFDIPIATGISAEFSLTDPSWKPVFSALNKDHVAEVITLALREGEFHERPVEIAICLGDDHQMAKLNAQFRDKAEPTNVLSFPAADLGAHLGDIAMGFGVVAHEAKENGKPIADHFLHLLTHGVLHLLGYDHMTDDDAEDMETTERRILAEIDIADPYQSQSVDRV